jgi:hypothetical protein
VNKDVKSPLHFYSLSISFMLERKKRHPVPRVPLERRKPTCLRPFWTEADHQRWKAHWTLPACNDHNQRQDWSVP